MPHDRNALELKVVDGLELDAAYRELLRPGEVVRDARGTELTLPRYFYEVESWSVADETRLSPHFYLREFLECDYREPALLRGYPRYIPLAVTLTATALELLRRKVGTLVRIATNGGYRSPSHAINRGLSPHCWGTAANIYKVGNRLLDSAEKHERYSNILQTLSPGVNVRPWGQTPGTVFDQMHIDLGYTVMTPVDRGERPQ